MLDAALRRRHHLHRHLGGLGLPGHGHRPGQPPGGRLGAGRPHAHRARRRRPRRWPSVAPATEPGSIFHSDRGCQYTQPGLRATSPQNNGVVLSLGRKGECLNSSSTPNPSSTLPTKKPPVYVPLSKRPLPNAPRNSLKVWSPLITPTISFARSSPLITVTALSQNSLFTTLSSSITTATKANTVASPRLA